MTTTIRTIALGLALAASATLPLLSSTPAEAKKGKEYYSQTYTSKKPLHGYEGRVGDYYCSYQRVPVHKINPKTGRMKVVAWELRQHCY